jgi:hypothetical protein
MSKGTIEEALPEESLIIRKQIQLYPFISFALHCVIIYSILFQRKRNYILMRCVEKYPVVMTLLVLPCFLSMLSLFSNPTFPGTKIRLVYLLSAMMSHSCHPNAEQSIHGLSDDLLFVLRATRQIKCGDQIEISYTEILAPTINRQFNLLTSKLFVCHCTRCVDPTDLGSYASALKCTICMKKTPDKIGYILSFPTNIDQWQCSKCKSKFSTVNIQNLVFKIHDELEKVIDSPLTGVVHMEKHLKKYR